MSPLHRAAGSHPRFRSKVDVWFGAVVIVAIAIGGAAAIGLVFQEGMTAFAIIPLLVTALPVWLLLDTWYGVTGTDLIVRCGPFRTVVPLSSIRAVRPTGSVLSAPALSLDRLEVTHAGGALVVSPADKAGFIRALHERRADINTASAAAPPGAGPRLLKWALPMIPVVGLGVTLLAVLSGTAPLRVEITPLTVIVHGSFGTTVPLADITAVSLVETLPHLRRTMGYGALGTMRGRATSRDLGERGHAYVSRNSPPFVIATTKDGFLVFNSADPAQTRRLFGELQSQLEATTRPTVRFNRP